MGAGAVGAGRGEVGAVTSPTAGAEWVRQSAGASAGPPGRARGRSRGGQGPRRGRSEVTPRGWAGGWAGEAGGG